MRKILCILLFCCLGLISKAQFIDSLQSAIEKKGSFSFNVDSRDSYIDNNLAYIFGFSVGVCFDKKITIGGGINILASTISSIKYTGGDTLKGKLKFSYISYFAEYTMALTKHWTLDFPVYIGIGSSSYQYTNKTEIVIASNKIIMPLEPQVELDYNFNKYVGLYTQVGYRYMLVNKTLLGYDFNSVTYSVGMLIAPLQIYAGLFPHSKLARMIED